MSRLDRWLEDSARGLARGLARAAGRRSFLARVGRLSLGVIGAAALPILPVARANNDPRTLPDEVSGSQGDPAHCDYWRHCAIDGFLCACCGGSATSCPPGTSSSPVTWVGTCLNPADDQHYLISYNDCCGRSFCGRCNCNSNEGERPDYHWYRANDINWCGGASNQLYNCSIARVVGLASEQQPER